MKKKCPNCELINFPTTQFCTGCQNDLTQIVTASTEKRFAKPKILRRIGVLIVVCVFTVLAFYLSLIFSAQKLNYDERQAVESGIGVLQAKGFADEVFLLRYVTAFRSNDHWLNASVVKENAYAATNFPFEIMVLYPDFFSVPVDDTERAAILLHEAKHLQGAGEPEAYEFVWRHRRQLGWTKETYESSVIWSGVRKTTQELAPQLFVCEEKEYNDCTE